ncbi:MULTISPECIES: biotin-independent malonate decarboxylase subunit gamma [unclassified Mesorhizobium]|uniref:biotin-independent malonate decarboxylase subunit gamma n=1 Tax=unclassified Mesorhizobium TaxID=325217 RepID=UPI000FCA018C|nr:MULTISPECIES: biotin-independent malonate decarboxylase subunit gamma [unclassified Mesorhizobium]RUV12270.1 biotin-independent malonate decarboxylase subunit gamma [Mesorhizobium sp. M1A.F.Ca.IN.022.04.1.1]RWG37200.1 MAG: biotin-independent malonate decarboxylase subunit gamma [Mesorhizobium sp.]
MQLAEILSSLFPFGHEVSEASGLVTGVGWHDPRSRIDVVGICGKIYPGVDEAVAIAGHILEIAARGDRAPLLFLVDSGSQRMSRRDELLGLSETLAHLAKALWLTDKAGHRTVGLLYGGSAAGAFIATALACRSLVALPCAWPEVMDLPSIARVTKLPIDVLRQKAATTPVFAPGLDNLFATGGIMEIWNPTEPLSDQLGALLAEPARLDLRARLGAERGGRLKAAAIAAEVERLAISHG